MTTTTVRLHAGTVTDYNGTTFGAGGGLTGSGALWDDASDSTYLTSQAIPSTTIARGKAPLDQLVLPAGATVTDVTTNVRIQQTAGAYQTHVGVRFRLATGSDQFSPTSPSGDVQGISIPSSGSILDLAVTATDFASWPVATFAGLVSLLTSSGCYITAQNIPNLNGSFVAIASTIRVYELSVDVTYDVPTTGQPPLRLTNRDDQYSSAPSLTRRTSRQGSNRLTGYL